MKRKRSDLHLGRAGDHDIFLTPTDRSTHLMCVGAPGSGKTTFLEHLIRQDIAEGRGLCLIDPQGPLFARTLAYCAYQGVTPIVLDLSSDWVTGFNPFFGAGDDLAVHVERRVQSILKTWGARDGDDTPRLEKWLRLIFTVVAFHKLTILEAGLILVNDKLRDRLVAELPATFGRSVLSSLSELSSRDFEVQIESIVSRLLRFGEDTLAGLTLGVGSNAINFPELMDTGAILLVRLAGNPRLSQIQQRTLGTLLITEMYDTAMRRRRSARPFYLYIDEASLFPVPELGDALNHCRQKGLHVTFAFQNLAQFREADPKLYGSIRSSALTKIIFKMSAADEALELTDDITKGLADPVVKHIQMGVSYKQEDVYLPTFQIGLNVNSASTDTKTTTIGSNESETHGRSEGDSESESATKSKSTTHSTNASHTVMATETKSASHGKSEHPDAEYGHSSEGESVAFTEGGTKGHGTAEQEGEALTKGKTHTKTYHDGVQTGTSRQKAKGKAETTGFGLNFGLGFAPSVKHTEFMEEKGRQFFTLEENRRRAADEIQFQERGHCVISTPKGVFKVQVPKPGKHWTSGVRVLECKERAFAAHSIPRAEAARLVAARQAALLNPAPPQSSDDSPKPKTFRLPKKS